MTTLPQEGYLVFTTHDGDECDATFVPKSEEMLLNQFREAKCQKDEEDLQEVFAKWKGENEVVDWRTQTRCETKWPFNNHVILGTFFLLVY